MNKKLLSGLAAKLVFAVAVILGGAMLLDYSFGKVMKKITLQKTTEQPTDTLRLLEKADTTIVLSKRNPWWNLIHLGQ